MLNEKYFTRTCKCNQFTQRDGPDQPLHFSFQIPSLFYDCFMAGYNVLRATMDIP